MNVEQDPNQTYLYLFCNHECDRHRLNVSMISLFTHTHPHASRNAKQFLMAYKVVWWQGRSGLHPSHKGRILTSRWFTFLCQAFSIWRKNVLNSIKKTKYISFIVSGSKTKKSSFHSYFHKIFMYIIRGVWRKQT